MPLKPTPTYPFLFLVSQFCLYQFTNTEPFTPYSFGSWKFYHHLNFILLIFCYMQCLVLSHGVLEMFCLVRFWELEYAFL